MSSRSRGGRATLRWLQGVHDVHVASSWHCGRRVLMVRWYSSPGSERMRVAIVGGGVSGLSTALHLAPLAARGLIAAPIDVYEASPKVKGRSIGVGIWSTALESFRQSSRPSHQLVWERMTAQGSWIDQVGYRTPPGDWLVHSRLSTGFSKDSNNNNNNEETPGLLFLRESDVQSTLRMAVAAEEHLSTIQVHCNAPVISIDEASPHSWSAALLLEDGHGHGQVTDRDYHLIVAADGIHSRLRKTYGGGSRRNEDRRLTGASAFPTSRMDPDIETLQTSWDEQSQEEATLLEDRQYTVFRGNAPMASSSSSQPLNFQTWGLGKSMRFATVHMTHPGTLGKSRDEKQVWFITMEDSNHKILNEPDPVQRQQRLLEAFKDWHQPIRDLVASTPAHQILAERAMAHCHSIAPVDDMNRVLQQIRGKRPPSSGKGPAMVFIGDAFMTVDPILAQGFSVGMEAAADLVHPVQASCQRFQELLFDPYKLRQELAERHERRCERLVCLLRATEIVQALGQPRDGTVSGFLAKNVLRPLMKISPNFMKTPIFNAMLTYSLGLGWSGKAKTKTK